MVPSKFICHTLYVRHPILSEQSPDNVGDFSMPSCGPCAAWKVLITRRDAQLEVAVGLWGPNKDIDLQSISLAPFKGGKHWNSTLDQNILKAGSRVTGEWQFVSQEFSWFENTCWQLTSCFCLVVQIPIEDVERDGEYQFFIALSTIDPIPATSSASIVEALKDEVAFARNKAQRQGHHDNPSCRRLLGRNAIRLHSRQVLLFQLWSLSTSLHPVQVPGFRRARQTGHTRTIRQGPRSWPAYFGC